MTGARKTAFFGLEETASAAIENTRVFIGGNG